MDNKEKLESMVTIQHPSEKPEDGKRPKMFPFEYDAVAKRMVKVGNPKEYHKHNKQS